MTDERFQFGALGAWQTDEKPIEFGFQFPGTASMYAFGPNAPQQPRWIRRFHPVFQDLPQLRSEFSIRTQRAVSRSHSKHWRWAWSVLKPAVVTIDVEQVRRVLTDHLAAQAATIDERTAIPFAVATFDTSRPQWNWTMRRWASSARTSSVQT